MNAAKKQRSRNQRRRGKLRKLNKAKQCAECHQELPSNSKRKKQCTDKVCKPVQSTESSGPNETIGEMVMFHGSRFGEPSVWYFFGMVVGHGEIGGTFKVQFAGWSKGIAVEEVLVAVVPKHAAGVHDAMVKCDKCGKKQCLCMCALMRHKSNAQAKAKRHCGRRQRQKHLAAFVMDQAQ